ncbi:MAG: SRPBCC domain-containing protein [Pseudomonadota bacterium]
MIRRILTWVFAPLALLSTVSACTTKEFRAEATVAAPPEAVWDVLVDTAAYSDWNPVFVGVDGTYSEGATVKNSVMFPDGNAVDMDAKVKTYAPARELRQTGGIPLVLTFDHRWTLEPIDGGTRVTQYEIDRGFYLWFWDSSWVEPAYQRTTDALKARVEGASQ